MFKYFNCFFSSFFRTLGRIIVYILLGLVFSSILSKIDVHADSDKYVKLNGSTLNYKDYISIGSGNRTFEFDEGTLYTTPSQIPQNFLITFCSDTPKITSWYSNVNDNEFPHELNIYKTDIPCQFSTTDYNGGRIVYFYGTSFSFSVTGSNGTAWGRWTFYEPTASSYQLLNFITTNDDISIDFSSGAVISQNQQIINQNQEIINGQNNIINNQNQNKNDIINNQNENTDKTIENQNENTDKQIDSQKVCTYIDNNKVVKRGYFLSSNGSVSPTNSNWGITDYISIVGGDLTLVNKLDYSDTYMCFYDANKTLISCSKLSNLTANSKIDIPTNSNYFRSTIVVISNLPTFNLCQNGNQAIGGGLNDINGSLNNSDTTDATNDANNFFNNFTTDLHGLTGIITAPLNAINSLTNKTCSPLVLPLPFVDKDLTLPCMRSIYDEHFGAFMTLYDTITFGIVSYWVCVRIFSLVKDFKNPEHDEIEVVDL